MPLSRPTVSQPKRSRYDVPLSEGRQVLLIGGEVQLTEPHDIEGEVGPPHQYIYILIKSLQFKIFVISVRVAMLNHLIYST